jgi:DNA-binding transcriptional MerR regulator
MTQAELLSINTVAAKLGLSVHQLRRWELMFGLEIKRGRGQQRQYRSEDLTILERIKELVEQGWPTSQIRPQLEAEGLITPKLIGVPQQPGNPEMLMEAVIGLRSFAERRFIEISKQIDELRQLMISITLRNELRSEIASPWQPVDEEFAPPSGARPPEEIKAGASLNLSLQPEADFTPTVSEPPVLDVEADRQAADGELAGEIEPEKQESEHSGSEAATEKKILSHGLGEINDQNHLTVLGRALDMIGWSDEQADQYSQTEFAIAHWDELGRRQSEKLIAHLLTLLDSKDKPFA